MEDSVKAISLLGSFDGMSTSKKGIAKLKFEFFEGEFLSATKLVTFLDENVNVYFKFGADREYIGELKVVSYKVNKDFNTKLELEGLASDIDNLNSVSKLENNEIIVQLEGVSTIN